MAVKVEGCPATASSLVVAVPGRDGPQSAHAPAKPGQYRPLTRDQRISWDCWLQISSFTTTYAWHFVSTSAFHSVQ